MARSCPFQGQGEGSKLSGSTKQILASGDPGERGRLLISFKVGSSPTGSANIQGSKMEKIDISDVDDACFGVREQHYRDQLGTAVDPVITRQEFNDIAFQRASAEMLDEIHCMLRELLKTKET